MSTEKKSRYSIGRIALYVTAALLICRIGFYLGKANRTSDDKKPWSNENINVMHKALFDGFGAAITDTIGKNKMADCVIEKLKNGYPNGVDSLTKDSLKAVLTHYTEMCMSGIIVKFGWTPKMDSSLRAAVMKKAWMQQVLPKYRNPICDCYIYHFKKQFPDGFNDQIPKSEKDSLLMVCVDSLKK